MPNPSLNLAYVDRPEVVESFADSLENVMVDGATARFEFVVNRMDTPKPPTPPSGKKYTACRLVMPISALPALANQINNIMAALVRSGAVTQVIPMPVKPTSKPN